MIAQRQSSFHLIPCRTRVVRVQRIGSALPRWKLTHGACRVPMGCGIGWLESLEGRQLQTDLDGYSKVYAHVW